MAQAKELDRKEAVPAIIGNHEDFLIVSGLAGTAKDIAHLTQEAPNAYLLGGVMGAAVTMGLGLALAQPSRRVLVVTGDAEVMMHLGSLATVGVMQPPNLSILCVDNGLFQETGDQKSHTGHGADLEKIAQGAGIAVTRRVISADGFEDASAVLRKTNGPAFVLLKVSGEHAPPFRRSMDAADRKNIFRRALLGEA